MTNKIYGSLLISVSLMVAVLVSEVPLVNAVTSPYISLNQTVLTFNGTVGGRTPNAQFSTLSNTGSTALNWVGSTDQSWCHVSPASGTIAIGGAVGLYLTVDTLNTLGAYYCVVSISDPNADNNPQTISITYNVLPSESTTPTVMITSPSSDTIYTTEQSVRIDAFAQSDMDKIAYVNFYKDGVQYASVYYVNSTQSQYASPYIYWPVTAADSGNHDWMAAAIDSFGNVSSSSSPITLVVNIPDIASPVTSITYPLNNAVMAKGSKLTITADSSDNVGVVRTEIYLNGHLLCSDSSAPYSCSWNVPSAARKTYQLQSKAYDAAGNVGVSSIIKVTTK
jgi:hypothetical protein